MSYPDANTVKTLKVFDFSGKLWLEKPLASAGAQQVSLGGLKPGFYVVRLEKGADTVLVRKVIVVE